MAYVAATNWVSRGESWRDNGEGTTLICQGWQGPSYGQTKTFMTVMVFDVPANHYINSLSFKLTPAGGLGSSVDKTLKIVRPSSSAPKTFNQVSEDIRPTSEVLLQSATVKNGTQSTITADASLLAYLAEGYNYIVICNFETTGYSSYAYSYNYINCSGSTVEYTTTPITYPITYNSNGGSGTMSGGSKTHGVDYTVATNTFNPPASTSTNYTITLNGNGGTSPAAKTCTRTTTRSFSKWTLNSTSGTEYAAGAKYTTNAAATFYAKWGSSTSGSVVLGSTTRANSPSTGYKVTYNGNGGSSSVANQSATDITQYTFTGWNSAANGTGTAYNSTTSYAFTANATLYAQWSSTTTKGSITLPTVDKCTRTGYTCIGWATSSGATTANYDPGATYKPTSNITLYAVWKANDYKVSYNANGGSGTMTDSTATYDAAFLTKQNTLTPPAGYKFNGWNESADGTGVVWGLTSLGVYEHGIPWTWTYPYDITLYAQWAYNVRTLTINPNGGRWNNTTENSSIEQEYNTTFVVADPVRIGYTFTGWTASGGGTLSGNIYTFGADNGTLTASWDAKSYEIIFDSNGGSGSMDSLLCAYDTTYVLPDNCFTRKGYSFLGWSTNKNATTPTYTDGESVLNLTTANTIYLYAVWEGYDYSILYYSNDDTDTLPTVSVHKVGIISQLASLSFTREGYIFLGWATSETGTPIYADSALAPADLVTTNNETISLYAIWSKKSLWTLCSVGFFAPTSATDPTLKWWII